MFHCITLDILILSIIFSLFFQTFIQGCKEPMSTLFYVRTILAYQLFYSSYYTFSPFSFPQSVFYTSFSIFPNTSSTKMSRSLFKYSLFLFDVDLFNTSDFKRTFNALELFVKNFPEWAKTPLYMLQVILLARWKRRY